MTKEQQHRIGICIALVVLTVATFARTLANDFINLDDPLYITENPDVRYGISFQGVAVDFTTTRAGFWIPLTWLSYQVDYQLYGLSPAGFHATNVLLHAANVVLSFLVFSQATGAIWRSAMLAALFAVHPLQVESVVWVTERKDVLSTFFWMLALYAYLRYSPGRQGRWLLWTLTALSLGLMAKPMLVTLPCVMLLLDYWPLSRFGGVGEANAKRVERRPTDRVDRATGLPTLVKEKLSFFAVVILFSVATVRLQSSGMASLEDLPLGDRIANASVAYMDYLAKAALPLGLCPFYPHPRGMLPAAKVLAAVVVLATISGVAVWQRRNRPYLLVGWLWFLGTLFPVIGLSQSGMQAMADRFSYLPLTGVFLAIVWLIVDFWQRCAWSQRFLAGLAVALVSVYTAFTVRQVGYWHDSVTLWSHTLRVTTDNADAHHLLGTAFWNAGELDQAGPHFREAIRIDPGNPDAHFAWARVLWRQGDAKEAARHFAKAAQLNPDFAEAHCWHGKALAALGQYEGAADACQRAIDVRADLAVAHACLGEASWALKNAAEALAAYTTASELAPDLVEAQVGLGLIYEASGDGPRAIAHYRRAVELTPGVEINHRRLAYLLAEQNLPGADDEYRAALELDPGWPDRLNRAAWTLATTADVRRRNGVLALRLAKQACQATRFQKPEFLDTLAACYADLGDFDSAGNSLRRALSTPTIHENPDLAAAIHRHLQLYENGHAFHEANGDNE